MKTIQIPDKDPKIKLTKSSLHSLLDREKESAREVAVSEFKVKLIRDFECYFENEARRKATDYEKAASIEQIKAIITGASPSYPNPAVDFVHQYR